MFNSLPDFNFYNKLYVGLDLIIVIIATKRIAMKHITDQMGDLYDYFLTHCNTIAIL